MGVRASGGRAGVLFTARKARFPSRKLPNPRAKEGEAK